MKYDPAEMARRARIGNARRTPDWQAKHALRLKDYWEGNKGNGRAIGAKGSLERYLSARYKLNDRGCWEWTLSTAGKGYGYFEWEGEWEYAHRAAWKVWRGPIPDDKQVLHHCDNPPCFNPDHLFLGTQLDNIRDMDAKGRRRPKQRKNPDARGIRLDY